MKSEDVLVRLATRALHEMYPQVRIVIDVKRMNKLPQRMNKLPHMNTWEVVLRAKYESGAEQDYLVLVPEFSLMAQTHHGCDVRPYKKDIDEKDEDEMSNLRKIRLCMKDVCGADVKVRKRTQGFVYPIVYEVRFADEDRQKTHSYDRYIPEDVSTSLSGVLGKVCRGHIPRNEKYLEIWMTDVDYYKDIIPF